MSFIPDAAKKESPKHGPDPNKIGPAGLA